MSLNRERNSKKGDFKSRDSRFESRFSLKHKRISRFDSQSNFTSAESTNQNRRNGASSFRILKKINIGREVGKIPVFTVKTLESQEETSIAKIG
jgi:hypothetical protein